MSSACVYKRPKWQTCLEEAVRISGVSGVFAYLLNGSNQNIQPYAETRHSQDYVSMGSIPIHPGMMRYCPWKQRWAGACAQRRGRSTLGLHCVMDFIGLVGYCTIFLTFLCNMTYLI